MLPGTAAYRGATRGLAGVSRRSALGRATALDKVDVIAALDDVDALYMGPADLSNDLGLPPDLLAVGPSRSFASRSWPTPA
jgi:HpcH/HpaI aldolase/citrate lyase family